MNEALGVLFEQSEMMKTTRRYKKTDPEGRCFVWLNQRLTSHWPEDAAGDEPCQEHQGLNEGQTKDEGHKHLA